MFPAQTHRLTFYRAPHGEARSNKSEVKNPRVWLTGFLLFAFSGSGAIGAMPRDYQVWPTRQDEYAKLPPYCTARLKANSADPQFKALSSSMTSDFIHIHHYCAGLNVMNYYYRTTGNADKQRVLREAVNQFSYMVDKAKPGWYMMPEIYAARGEAYLLAGNFGAAVTDLTKAISLNPNFLKPYILLADHYQKIKQVQNALEITIEGLKHNPESKGLQTRYLSLGGKEPFPEPDKKAIAAEAAVPEKVGSDGPGDDTVSGAATANVPTPAPTAATDMAQNPPPKIGIPGNPYCRFCPDPATAELPPGAPAGLGKP